MSKCLVVAALVGMLPITRGETADANASINSSILVLFFMLKDQATMSIVGYINPLLDGKGFGEMQ